MLSDPAKLQEYRYQMRTALEEKRYKEAAKAAAKLSSGRAAIILQDAKDEDAINCLRELKPIRAASILGHMPPEAAGELLEEMDNEEQASLASYMPEDRLVDILAMLDEDDSERLISTLEPDSQEIVSRLMGCAQGSVGAAMSGYFLAVREGTTVEGALEAVKEAPSQIDNRSYVYILNSEEKLTGVVSLKELLSFPSDQPVERIMVSPVIAVHADEDAVEAARTMRNRRIKMLPVLNEKDRMVGIYDLEDALEITTQDIANQMAIVGAGSPDESFYTPPLGSVKKRLPWMAGNVFLNLGAVAVISSFETTIDAVAILAAFLPMITDMGGNVGIQALSVSIRSLALGEVRVSEYWEASKKELVVGLINGIALGALFAVIAFILQGNAWLGLVAGLALGINVLVAGVVGGSLPFIIKKAGKDPAMMTGPLLTTITDITGVSIYLGLSTIFLLHIIG